MPFYELDGDTPARVVLEQIGPKTFRILEPFRYVDASDRRAVRRPGSPLGGSAVRPGFSAGRVAVGGPAVRPAHAARPAPRPARRQGPRRRPGARRPHLPRRDGGTGRPDRSALVDVGRGEPRHDRERGPLEAGADRAVATRVGRARLPVDAPVRVVGRLGVQHLVAGAVVGGRGARRSPDPRCSACSGLVATSPESSAPTEPSCSPCRWSRSCSRSASTPRSSGWRRRSTRRGGRAPGEPPPATAEIRDTADWCRQRS